MEVTQIYVEQVIIGALLIVTVFVLVMGHLPVIPKDVPEIIAGLVFIGGSYIAGVFYDRCADTLLERVERRHRARFVKQARLDQRKRNAADPFEEFGSKHLIDLPAKTYIESRMRILRALTTLLPAMTVAALVFRNSAERSFAAPATGILYLLCGIACELTEFPSTRYWDTVAKALKWPSPLDPAPLALAAMTLLALLLAARDSDWTRALQIAIAGTILTLVTGWAWLRVNATLMHLILKTPPRRPDA